MHRCSREASISVIDAGMCRGIGYHIKVALADASFISSQQVSTEAKQRSGNMYIILREPKTYFPGAGFCIYCNRRPPEVSRLTREHIIPAGIKGELVFHQASCDDCAKIINQEIENFCLGSMVSARTTLGMIKKSKEPATLKYGRWRGPKGVLPPDMGNVDFEWRDIASSDMPLTLVMPQFAVPGILSDRKPDTNFIITGVQCYIDEKRLPTPQDGRAEAQFMPFSPDKFCRMIAKIAHGVAVAEIGIENFVPFLPKIILGEDGNISYFVGGSYGKTRKEAAKHKIKLFILDGYLTSDIYLFANLGYPPYRAVVGKAKQGLIEYYMSGKYSFDQKFINFPY